MDYGHDQTDKLLQMVENKINANYKAAQKHIQKKADDALKKFKKKDKQMLKHVKKGEITQAEYLEWRTQNMLAPSFMGDLSAVLASDLSNANQIATSIVNNEMPSIFALNSNYGMYEIDKALGVKASTSFALYDHDTVIRLMRKDPEIVPKAKVNIPKDKVWNRRKVYSAMSQGILAGDSIPHIADRLQSVTDMNRKSAIRNARTYTTAAENGGRIDSYMRAKALGIDIKKEWMATLDASTRPSHRILDGEQVEVEDTFSNGLRYPGDPKGLPAEIYNCRCRLVAADPMFKDEDAAQRANRFSRLPEGMSYEEWKYGKEYGDIKALEDQLTAAQANLQALPNKTYSGIWKNDVTLADYANKKASIPAKMQYYEDKIKEAELLGINTDRWEGYIKDLKDFEKNGKLYEKYRGEIDDISYKLSKLRGETGPFTSDAYTDARIRAALRFTDKYEADRYFRPLLDAGWDNLTEKEKYSLWLYTRNSHPMNQPLSGYNDGWSRYEFVGVGNANWSLQDSWRGNYLNDPDWIKKFGKDGMSEIDYHDAITDLTLAIDKFTAAEDSWVVRGSSVDGLAGLFEGDLFSFDDAKRILEYGTEQEMVAAFKGQTFTFHSFMSTGMAEGTGLPDSVSYSIYIPKGTHVVYAEPQSYYGYTISDNEIYKAGKPYSMVGDEAERLIQRGSQYRIRDIKKTGYGSYHVEMEVVGQPNYFRYGDEETFNMGATRHKKRN